MLQIVAGFPQPSCGNINVDHGCVRPRQLSKAFVFKKIPRHSALFPKFDLLGFVSFNGEIFSS